MGQRHMLNAPRIRETDGDQGWNHANHPYAMARAGTFESSSLGHPVENMAIQGGPSPSSATRSRGYSSSLVNAELAHYQPEAPGPSRDPFLPQPADRNSHMVPYNCMHHPSSSSLTSQTAPRVAKRRSPSAPHQLCDMGSTIRYYDVGTPSNLHLPADTWHGKQNAESGHTPWKYRSGYGVNSLSISGESMPRNVRSRAGVDPEHNPVRAHLTRDFPHHPFSSRSISDQTNYSVDFSRRSLITPKTERNWVADHGVTIGSGSGFSHDLNTPNALNCHSNGSAESGGRYSNKATSNRNIVPQNANRDVNQSIRGVQSGYDQRTVPTFRASSSNFHAGQGLVAVDRSALYGSRNPFDQHMDMRLNVDNMSYEELLVLGERIGSVSTGLHDNLISKCLTESIFCASDQFEDDGRCVICLEEYKHMDDVGNLKCGHDFHVGCIRKWLSMKNLCPICKASAMDESNKEK